MHGWDIVALLGLSMLGRRGAQATARCMEGRLLLFLSEFADNPKEFRDEMRRNVAVLAGDCALAFLKGVPVDRTTMNVTIYCADQGFDQFCVFLVGKLGGVIEHHMSDVPAPSGPVYAADPPYNRLHIGIHERCIITTHRSTFDVMRSTTGTPLSAVAHAPSTLLMNYVGADRLCIAYPWTFDDDTAILSTRGDATEHHRIFCEQHGYTLHDDAASYWGSIFQNVCVPHGYCPKTLRWFDDDYSLSLRYSSNAAYGKREPVRHSIGAYWVFGGKPCEGARCCVSVQPFVDTMKLHHRFTTKS